MRVFAALLVGLGVAAGCSNSDGGNDAPRADDAGADVSINDAAADEEATGDSEAGADAGMDSSADAGDLRARLSQTGLFASVSPEVLGPGVAPYAPRYELWADGATKRRWLYLPPGAQIDTSDMDYWVYPVGTKIWKEFSKDGKRLETRLIEKTGPAPENWFMVAYKWNSEQTDALALPLGEANVGGTTHDIPTQADCGSCHEAMKDRVLGVSAIQLSHDGDGVTLATLADSGRLTKAPRAGGYPLPGSETEQKALGYLHANCGQCHNPYAPASTTMCLQLWLTTDHLGSVADTPTFATTVGVQNESSSASPAVPCRILGQDLTKSAIYTRMNARDTTAMPPLASEQVDATGLGLIRDFIQGLPAGSTCTPTDACR